MENGIINTETRLIDLTVGDLINAISSKQSTSVFEGKVDEDEIGGIELAENITGLARQTIYGKVSERKISFIKIPHSKKLYFSKKDLNEWLQSHKKLTDYDIAAQATEYIINRKAIRK